MIHLGRATSKVETADPIAIPDVVPDNDPEAEEETTDGWHHGGGGTRRHDRRHGATGGITSPTTTPTAAGPRPPTRALPPAELASGLPPLFSIPGLLLFGAHRRRRRGRQLRTPDRRWRPSAVAVRARTASTPACPTCER